jgi:MSHA biogenesis protein MshP
MSMVVIAMSRLSITQHGSNSLAIQQARAYQAARAGLEWGISRAYKTASCAVGNPSQAGSALAEFSVSVACTSNSYTDNVGRPLQIFRLTATAQNGAPGSRPDYAFRSLTAVVER